MIPLTPEHVQATLDTFNLGLSVTHYDQTTHTSEDAAAAIGCRLGQIAKSMCLIAAGEPVLVVAAGDRRLSDAKLARYLAVGRKKVKIATPAQCLELFGYPPGGVSPVGHRTAGLRILIDESLDRWERIHAAAGTSNDNFALTFEQLLEITAGEVLDCTEELKGERMT